MTTHVHVYNGSDSNPQQHVDVKGVAGGQPVAVKLAPGEGRSWWLAGTDGLSVTEIFAPKPKE